MKIRSLLILLLFQALLYKSANGTSPVANKGTITVESNVGEGSCFSITLPVESSS